MGYYTYMKTTLDLSDHILLRAKRIARERRRTLRSLAEQGLLQVLDQMEAEESPPPRPVTFGGTGLQDEFRDEEWSRFRKAAYEGHGG